MMFGGYESIEAYEDDLYREESSSESVDSEVEFQLYSQIHYARDLGDTREEEPEEKDSGDSESPSSEPNQKNIIVLSDSEVIQLSDGSDVITLSDEDSIYKCKRKNIRVQPQEKIRGSPAFFHSKALTDKRKNKNNTEKPKPEERPGVIKEVMIVEIGSSEDEDSTISESDNVESWMLLGCEVDDDKDDDILLNLVGCEKPVNEGEDGVNWFISDKDIEAQIVNNRSSGRLTRRYYSVNKNVICRNCDKCGHLSKNCPLPKKVRSCCLCSERGHLQYACPDRFCFDCSLPMSSSHRCFERSSWRKRCDRCDMIGHYADACPEIWRQYHLTITPGPPKKPKTPSGQSTLVYCYNCAQKGHFGHECAERRMFNHTFPTSPFIYYYDNKYEIQEREKRIKRKVKELQKKEDISGQFKRPHMEAADMKLSPARRNSHGSWRKKRWPREQPEIQKDAVSRKSGKHWKADRLGYGDEDFPRGPKDHRKPPQASHHSPRYHRPGEKQPKEGTWGKKKKKGSRLDHDDNDNLFLIKQRRKKT
ncbi:PREDICTED: zinc finger CCHC domain-containing protein 7 [Elephantulus edwardii]|uniref:zinc finger CCHC domain-containing protein 7 n=1 Tax=Elephantulus edwardii TaxID=28737 RepID=UPI0003F0D9AC|nr:PREDICTED: zinc finger CCHC domain-containing protein 7 [Elephantulus edwardii]